MNTKSFSVVFVSIFQLLAGIGCESASSNGSSSPTSDACGTTWTQVDQYGNLKKYASHVSSSGACLVANQSLTRWEQTNFSYSKYNVQCAPVPTFASRSLKADSNFYSYRDQKVFYSLNSETGVYRRIVLGEDAQGKPTFSRLKSCFYERNGEILFDTDVAKLATSSAVDLWEIYSYTQIGSNLELIRFDDSNNGWTAYFCPTLKTEEKYCTKLRNGDIMYQPVLSSSDLSALLAEAVLIRKTFSYTTMADADFETLWSTVDKTRTESERNDWRYDVMPDVDTPIFIDASWKAFVKREIKIKPNTSTTRILPVCWSGSTSVTLANGQPGKVYGQICFSSAAGYTFTAR